LVDLYPGDNSPGVFGGIILENVIKYVTMTRFAPERPKAPTSYTVQECDIDKMKARGWIVKEESKEPVKTEIQDEKTDENVPVENKEGTPAEPVANKRGRKPKADNQEEN
jgi:hypothetical protein